MKYRINYLLSLCFLILHYAILAQPDLSRFDQVMVMLMLPSAVCTAALTFALWLSRIFRKHESKWLVVRADVDPAKSGPDAIRIVGQVFNAEDYFDALDKGGRHLLQVKPIKGKCFSNDQAFKLK